MIVTKAITIASGGTTSVGFHFPGHRLVGLVLPTLDSTTIQFAVSQDDSTYTDVYTNSGATAAFTLGNANTGARAQGVPEEVSRLSAVGFMRLVTAAQNGGARTITGLFEKV